MGFADFLSSALTVGTQAAGAHEQGLAQRGQNESQDLLQKIQLARQANQDAMAKRLHEAQIGNYESLAADRLKPEVPRVVPRQDVTLNIRGKPVAGSFDPSAGKYYYEGQEVQNPEKFVSPDPMTRFFEGQRQEQDQRQAAQWQQLYLKYLGNPADPNSESMEPAEAAAAADAAFGGHPRLAPKVGGPPPMGTAYTPAPGR